MPLLVDPDEAQLTRGLRRVAHIAGARQMGFLIDLLHRDYLPSEGLDGIHGRWLTMLLLSLFGTRTVPSDAADGVAHLRRNPTLRGELCELLEYRQAQLKAPPSDIVLPFACPLELHGVYTRDEVLAALGHWTLQRRPDMREGVLHLAALPADVFFITLNKTETDYSPSTMYRDYAISDQLFHWQSQSTTSADSPTGLRYREHRERGSTVLLFVREQRGVQGLSSPYAYLGPADYVSHEGSRPMSIVWQLRYPMPAYLTRQTARAADV